MEHVTMVLKLKEIQDLLNSKKSTEDIDDLISELRGPAQNWKTTYDSCIINRPDSLFALCISSIDNTIIGIARLFNLENKDRLEVEHLLKGNGNGDQAYEEIKEKKVGLISLCIVKESERNQGLGQDMILALEKEARHNKLDRLALEVKVVKPNANTVPCHAKEKLSFWTNLGFKESALYNRYDTLISWQTKELKY